MNSKKTITGFNIFKLIKTEIDSFYNNSIHLAGKKNEGSVKYLNKDNVSYSFNQSETLNLIDMYWNSKFSSG